MNVWSLLMHVDHVCVLAFYIEVLWSLCCCYFPGFVYVLFALGVMRLHLCFETLSKRTLDCIVRELGGCIVGVQGVVLFVVG